PHFCHLVIRRYHPSDKDTVCELFSVGITEHIGPCFYNAMTTPLYITITTSLCIAGYFLGSWLGALLLPVLWMCVVYYCCREVYAGYVRNRLHTEMQDIPGNYMSRQGDCFWVAEAEEGGRAQIVGTMAVVARENGAERFGELFRMIISPTLCLTFVKESGFSKVVLETSSTQAAAVALYKKIGFKIVRLHKQSEAPKWVILLSQISIIEMEKHI
uniref:Si:ch211-81n22.1 n=1 Tax=Neogobius melanostomus TaxID=47308 RepID=A0A8C6UP42_9GOBI